MSIDKPYFRYSAALRIFSDSNLDFEDIQEKLVLSPTKTHRKGEQRSPNATEYAHDMWMYRSKMDDSEPLGAHLTDLWTLLKPNKHYLLNLKRTATVDIFCGYRSDSDTAGIHVSHESLEIFRELKIDFRLSIIVI